MHVFISSQQTTATHTIQAMPRTQLTRVQFGAEAHWSNDIYEDGIRERFFQALTEGPISRRRDLHDPHLNTLLNNLPALGKMLQAIQPEHEWSDDESGWQSANVRFAHTLLSHHHKTELSKEATRALIEKLSSVLKAETPEAERFHDEAYQKAAQVFLETLQHLTQ